MTRQLDIEDSSALLQYLRETRWIDAGETPRLTNLKGGISNRTMLVERANGRALVLKQALPKLRVQTDWPSDPRRVHQEALGLTWLERLAPPGSVPHLLFEDSTQHLLGMEAVPQPHENWKTRLLSGALEMTHVRQFGDLLGKIHCRSRERQSELAPIFANQTHFDSLRLEPYYRYTASQHPAAKEFFEQLIAQTAATRVALTHGDYSPKNILIGPGRFVLLDHEVIHWGDPAFDIGFSLTHLLSKGHHLGQHRQAFFDAARGYWETYCSSAGGSLLAEGMESRAVRHTLGCLLARVDGRSPLEYLTPHERERQRRTALELISAPPPTISALIDSFAGSAEKPAK